MSTTRVMIDEVYRTAGAVAAAAERWRGAVRGFLGPAPGRESQGQVGHLLVLPAQNLLPASIHLADVVTRLPEKYAEIDDPETRQRVAHRLEALALDVLSSHAGVLQALSDVAFEAASCRTLICDGDVFDVSGHSVLAAIGLLNLFRRAESSRDAPEEALISEELLDDVTGPLELADRHCGKLRPGDLWFLDLAARTVRAAAGRAATRDDSKPHAAALFRCVLPQFTSRSLLNKLIEADRLGKEVARSSRYRQWPGLECLLTDDGARSLRTFVVGEVARRVAADTVGFSRRAFFRFLEALTAVDAPKVAPKARLLIGMILWEMLELDADVLGRLLRSGQGGEALAEAIQGIKAECESDEREATTDRGRLREVRTCLRSYPQYAAVEDLWNDDSPNQDDAGAGQAGGAARLRLTP